MTNFKALYTMETSDFMWFLADLFN